MRLRAQGLFTKEALEWNKVRVRAEDRKPVSKVMCHVVASGAEREQESLEGYIL